jgi:2-polyprenyl-3-methyl-5-hydroxy-6-metoxy-1,4-benzoquinol methylase
MNGRHERLSQARGKRAELEAWLARTRQLDLLSLARHRLHSRLRALIGRYGRASLLDVGSGLSPFDRLYQSMQLHVTRLDREARSPGVELIADAQDMRDVKARSFDTVVCSQVLEHLPDPCAALKEMARVLSDGGFLILSVPHLSALHEVPDDYWRFTRFGLDRQLRQSGLEVISIEPTGGLFCFLGHLCSLGWMLTACRVAGAERAALKINDWLLIRLLGKMDHVFGCADLLPCDYVAVARKPGA